VFDEQHASRRASVGLFFPVKNMYKVVSRTTERERPGEGEGEGEERGERERFLLTIKK
jgi:hypothetical protein